MFSKQQKEFNADTRSRNYNANREADCKHKIFAKKAWKIGLVIFLVLVGALVAILVISVSHVQPEPLNRSETPDRIDIESDIEWDNAKIAVHYPRTSNDKINQILEKFAEDAIENFKKEIGEQPSGYDELNVSFKTYQYSEDIVSFAFDKYIYHQWQANGIDSTTTMTFNLATAERYELKDIFQGKYLVEISDLALKQLKDKSEFSGETAQANLKEGLAAKEENFNRFVLDKDELIFIFDQYQLGARIIPKEQVSILTKDLKDYLKEPFKPVEDTTVIPTTPETPAAITTEAPSAPQSDLSGRKLVALTFDDGPHLTNTARLLDILKHENAYATFFMLGARVNYYPDLVRRVYQEGSEVAGHSYNHKVLIRLSATDLQYEINTTNDVIEKIIGVRPTVMRPPYGEFNNAVKNAAGGALVLWSVDPEDWRYLDANIVYNNVMANVRDGSIVLMHDIHATTIDAIEKIIPALKAQGYTLVTVDQLILARGGSLAAGNVYRSMYP